MAVAEPDGKPAASEVTLWAVDYSLLSLTNYKTPDLVKAIYVDKPLQVATTDSRAQLMSRRPLAVSDEISGGVAGGVLGGIAGNELNVSAGAFRVEPPQPPLSGVEIRQDFRPLVFWLGSTTTDADGRATTTVRLPDSLTTYRIMAVAGNRASQFGFGEREVRVTKPLTLLTAFPRFLNQGDRASFGGVVTNSSKESGPAVVTIESLAPDVLQFAGAASRTLSIAAGASIPVKFDALASGSGSARVRMTVTLGAERDALEMPLDVARPLRAETTAAYGETTGTATEAIALPPGALPGSGGLTVDLSSSALVGLGEAARYLDEYPYGCAEQKASRALALRPWSGPWRCVQALDRQARRLPRRRSEGVDRVVLVSVRRGRVLAVARRVRKRLCVPDRLRPAHAAVRHRGSDRGQTGVKPGSDPDRASTPPSSTAPSTISSASSATRPRRSNGRRYGERRRPSRSKCSPSSAESRPTDIERLVGVAERLPIFALSYLADALAASGDKGPRYRDVIRRLTNSVRIDADRAHVEELDEAALAWLWNTNVRATAVVLEGLVRRKDDPSLAAPLVRWLLAARNNGRWTTTHENAMALEALVAYYRAFESAVPRMTTSVSVGSTTVGTRRSMDDRPTTQQLTLPMPALMKALTATPSPSLSISRTGTGRVHYTARVQSFAPASPESVDRGFRVERRYERYGQNSTEPVMPSSFNVGDLVRVTVAVTIRGEGRYLALTDPLPAGFEPIDAWFNTTARDLAQQATRTSGDDDWRSWWRGGYFDHVEKHDDHVVAFATRLGAGRHEFSYLVRATTVGTFGVGGARVEAMYAPELEGRSQAATVTVR